MVTGQIIDATSKLPVPNAEVIVVCSSVQNFDKNSSSTLKVIADKSGRYQARFDKGFHIEVASKASGYEPTKLSNKVSDNQIKIDLKLNKAQNNPTLKILH